MNQGRVTMRGGDKQVSIGEDIHLELKILAAKRGTTVRDLVTKAVEAHYGFGQKQKSA